MRFDHWVGKIPWRRILQPSAEFLPGESHGLRSLVGCSPWVHKTEQLTLTYVLYTASIRICHSICTQYASKSGKLGSGHGTGKGQFSFQLFYWRIDAFELWCWRRLLRVPWTAWRSNQTILKDWWWSWNSNTLTTWCEELTHWKRPWCWERLKVAGEGDDRG